MNLPNRLSGYARRLSAYGMRLSIAAPLVIASIGVPSVSSAIAQPPSTQMLPTIGQNHSNSESKESGHSGHGEMEHHDTDGMSESGEHQSHGHNSLEVDASQPIPQVSIAIEADSAKGWNLEIITSDFELTGATAGQAHSPGQGHAHLYANGEKIARVYGNWYHIPHLPSGEVVLEVVLNSNQHQALTHNGLPIAASTVVTVP